MEGELLALGRLERLRFSWGSALWSARGWLWALPMLLQERHHSSFPPELHCFPSVCYLSGQHKCFPCWTSCPPLRSTQGQAGPSAKFPLLTHQRVPRDPSQLLIDPIGIVLHSNSWSASSTEELPLLALVYAGQGWGLLSPFPWCHGRGRGTPAQPGAASSGQHKAWHRLGEQAQSLSLLLACEVGP